MSPELPEIQRTTISGVPTFFVDSPPPHTATLFFRVGAWDETVLTRGITHLAEHLALFPFRDSETAHNGFVLGTITGIVASGSQGEVGEFFKDFTSGLSNVPTDRMEKEAGVLLAESMRIAKGNLHLLLGIEFGLAGPGLESQPERGLWRTEELGVHDWIEKYFTRDNVVLVVSGGPPDQIELDLPEGERSVYVMPEDGLGYRPTTMETAGFQESGICIAGVVDRSVAMTVAVAVAGARLNDRLRHDLGIVYTPAVAYDPIDKDHAHVFVGADAQAPI